MLAERAGLRIHEVPVDWIDDADSRVDIMSTALGDLRGIRRVGWGLLRGSLKVPQLRAADPGYSRGLAWQLPRFLLIGVASTLAYVVLYLVFRGFMGAQAANALALLLTAVGNTAANRRLTFGVRGRAGAAQHQFRGLIAFGAGLALTSGALAVLHSGSRLIEVVVLVVANLAATLLRFVLYRGWVFGASPGVAGVSARAPAPRGLPRRSLSCPMSCSTSQPGALDERHDSPCARSAAASSRTRPAPALAGAGARPRVGAAGDARPAGAHRGALPVQPDQERLRQRLLRGRGAGGDAFVEGVLLRLVRLVELHHGGQDARVVVGDGAVRAGVRVQLVVDAGPEALEGVLSVWLLYLAVKRWFGPGAGLVAGLVLALTPAAALIFRFNNPDALLVLLMTASAYCVQRAIERDRTRWLVFAGLLLGFAFLAKMMQAFLVLPGFGVAYLWAGPARVRRRLWQVVAFGLGVVAGAGWWVVIAQLTPAADRPYFGGSTNNNILELALGYNGLGRLDGTETGSIGFNSSSVGGGPGGSGFGGATGIFRLFQSEFGGQVSWLIPAALISLGALLWVSRRPVSRGLVPVPGAGWRRVRDYPDAGVRRDLGRLAAGDRAGVQLHAGDHPPLLHGGPRPGDRRAGRRRRLVAVAGDGSAWPGARAPRPPWRRPPCGRSSSWTGHRNGCRGCGGWC